jgi:hypothetical protein
MPSIAFVAPLLPGKSDTDSANMASCDHGDRQADHVASRGRAGITREAVWLQPTPMGEVAVVYMEADDLEAAFKALGASEHPFDRWFRDRVRDVHGINLEDGFPPPEQLLDFTA